MCVSPTIFHECGVAPLKQLDIGNYACTLLFEARLAFENLDGLNFISNEK